MASFGTATFTAYVDTKHILVVVRALDTLRGLLVDDYGHVWTDEEKVILTAAVAALERENLSYAETS